MASTKTTNAVITYLLEFGSSPRIDIAKALSLTKASVTLVTNEMLSKGIIIEQGEIFDDSNKTVRGRRKILLSINPDYKVAIGVSIVGNNLTVGITNLNGDIFAKKNLTFTFSSINHLCDKITDEVHLLLKENLINEDDILALGIVLSKKSSEYLEGDNFDKKIDFLKTELSKKVHYQIVVGSIAKSSLMAQRVFGKTHNPNSLMMISLIEGVEISLCINSSIFTGKNNLSGGLDLIEKAITRYEIDNNVEILSETLSVCLSVMDLHNIFAFGGIISNYHIVENINQKLSIHSKIETPFMAEDTLFLSGCGQALFECLISQ